MQVGSVEEARGAVERGFDSIVVQGKEAGGHDRSKAGTFSLVPAIVDAVSPVPVIADGGISDGRGLVAALALGGEAVWCGTRFLASHEASAHSEYKARVVGASVEDTVRTTLFGPEWPGQPVRVIRNRVVTQWAGREAEAARVPDPLPPIGQAMVGGEVLSVPKFSAILPTPGTTGDFEEMCLTAGESSGNVRELQPAGEIVRDMLAEAERIITSRLQPATTV